MNDTKRVYALPNLSLASDLIHRYEILANYSNEHLGTGFVAELPHEQAIRLITGFVEEQLYANSGWSDKRQVDEYIADIFDWFTFNENNPYSAISSYFFNHLFDPLILQVTELMRTIQPTEWDIWEIKQTPYSLMITYLGDYRIVYFDTIKEQVAQSQVEEFEQINKEVLEQIRRTEQPNEYRKSLSYFRKYLEGPIGNNTPLPFNHEGKDNMFTGYTVRRHREESLRKTAAEITDPKAEYPC